MTQRSTTNESKNSRRSKRPSRQQQSSLKKPDQMTCFHSHGEVYFAGMEEPLKYTRVRTRPSRSQLTQLLTERWNLNPPTLIISIIGSRAQLSKRFKTTLKNGLWKAAESAGCLIVSDGLDRAMTKVAGEAVRDYTEAYGGNHMIMVAVTGLHRIRMQDMFESEMTLVNEDTREDVLKLLSRGRENQVTVHYPEKPSDEESDDKGVSAKSSLCAPYWPAELVPSSPLGDRASEQPTTVNSEQTPVPASSKYRFKQRFRLNGNHQFLILVDPDKNQKTEQTHRNRQLETRIMLERTIVTWAKPTVSSTTASSSTPASKKKDESIVIDEVVRKDSNLKSSISPSLRKPRASMALPMLNESIFDGAGPPRQSRIFSRQLLAPEVDQVRLGHGGSSQTSHLTLEPGAIGQRTGRSSFDVESSNIGGDMTARVPICGIVAGGGFSSVEQVFASVTLNRCPMVIVRGTGGMADVIANVIDFMNFKNSLEENVISDEDVNMKIASIIHETRSASHAEQLGPNRTKKQTKKPTRGLGGSSMQQKNTKQTVEAASGGTAIDYKAYNQQVELIRELVEEHAHLLSVFDSDDVDLDGYMISALLSSAGMDTPRNELNLDQLEIAIRLNRADIARTKIFLEGKRWKKSALDDSMFTVILNDQQDFVSLLLENGFNMEEFISVHTLERLYTECMKKTDYKTGLFQQLWERARIYKMDWVMLRDIGRIIKNLFGDFYQPLYLTKRFRNAVVQRGVNDSSDEEDGDGDVMNATESKNLFDKKHENHQSNTTSASTLREEEADLSCNTRIHSIKPQFSFNPVLSSSNVSKDSEADRDKLTTASSKSGSQKTKTSKNLKTPERSRKLKRQYSTSEKEPLLENVIKVEACDGDDETLKGDTDGSMSDASNQTLINPDETVSRRSSRKTSRQSPRTQTVPPKRSNYSPRNERRCIVRPITAFQLGYQPYIGFPTPIPTSGLLTFDPQVPVRVEPKRSQSMGRHRVIDGSRSLESNTRRLPPKAQMENSTFSNSVKQDGQSDDLNGGKEKSEKLNQSVKIDSPSHMTEVAMMKGQRRRRGHAVFADQPESLPSGGGRGMIRKAGTRVSLLQHRRKSSGTARRVAHSILHPLTDPELVQLQLREIERLSRERRREKERKRRHRVAQGKFTIMERLTGKADVHRMEELKPAKLANFAHTSTVHFDRPARELMVMCVLMGKLTMAQIFWSYEKEPIASALISCILLSEFSDRSDDVTCKEEYEEAARTFEEKADEVLEECHQEDRVRTQLLLCRKLEFYGGTSVIRLAARGRCIRFMAHPCCQELLSGVWMGGLSPKYTLIQFICGILTGLTFPPLLPQVMKYATAIGDDVTESEQHLNDNGDKTNGAPRKSIREQSSDLRYSLSAPHTERLPSRLKIQITRIREFYRAPVTRFIYNTIFYQLFLTVFSWTLLRNLTMSFSYNELFLVLMIFSFLCEELKQAFGSGCSLSEYISDGWNQLDCIAISLFIVGFTLRIQAYRFIQATDGEAARNQSLQRAQDTGTPLSTAIPWMMGLSFDQNITFNLESWINSSFDWTSLDFANMTSGNQGASFSTTAITTATEPMAVETLNGIVWSVDLPYYLLTDDLFTMARIFYAFSLFAFFVRLMYIFSFSMVLGPTLIMMNRMIIHDLLPFLAILLVCQMGYGIAFQSISFANGYYSYYLESDMNLNSTFTYKLGLRSIYDVVMTTYFQMLGEFRVDELEGENSACTDKNMCPQATARRLTVVMLSAYILLTQVLMFNLLVATFTSTYNEIEGSSQYFWCYQRYEMIQEFVDRPSVAPPFMLLWYGVELTNFILKKLGSLILGRVNEDTEDNDPFCRSLKENVALDRKLTKWEHMIGSRKTRDGDGAGARKWTGGARSDGHAIVLRSGGGGGGAGASKGLGADSGVGRVGSGDPSALLQGIGPIFGPETEFIEDRFHECANQLSKLGPLEEKLSKMVQSANGMVRTLRQVVQQQKQMMITLRPTDGRRLVGRGKKKDGTGPRNLIFEAVSNAVAGLGVHCSDIEEKIEEKIRIEEQCVKAVLTRSNGDEPEPDAVLKPVEKPQPRGVRTRTSTTGQIYERLVISHRLWRIVPFNFESYPGIRMNVPPEKLNWKVPYDEYRTFKITEDRLAVPYKGMDDDQDIAPQKLPYNQYDSKHGCSRMTCRGRVRVYRLIDAKTPETLRLVDLPLNPSGRSGLHGKGLLPHWGPNHSIMIAMTREHPEQLVQCGLPLIQVAVLFRNQNFCLPWYLTDHRQDCELHECTPNVVKALLSRRAHHLAKDKEEAISVVSTLKAATISLVSTGFLQDHLNADHAWVESVFLNIHQTSEKPFPDELLQAFLEDDQTEHCIWIDVCHQMGMRSSHDELLRRLALHRKAFYHEDLVDEHQQQR